jgi:hypothetical protein
MDKRCGTWSVINLYRTGSFITVAREIAKCKLDLGEVQVVRSERGGLNNCAGVNHVLGTGFLVHIHILICSRNPYLAIQPPDIEQAKFYNI